MNQQARGRNMRGPTALHVAAAAGRLENVETLLDLGAETDFVDGAGQTALHAAAYHDVTGSPDVPSLMSITVVISHYLWL